MITPFLSIIYSLNCQFKSSFLELNITKTKELVFGKGKAGNTPTPIYIDNQGVDIVSSFKYLGTLIGTNLTFCHHIDYVYKKAQQCLYLLRKLQSFGVSQHIVELVCREFIESILSFNIVTWYGNVNIKNRTKLARIVNIATKLIGREQNQLSKIYNEALNRKAIQIYHDDAHPLNAAFHVLPSGRRLKVPKIPCRKR